MCVMLGQVWGWMGMTQVQRHTKDSARQRLTAILVECHPIKVEFDRTGRSALCVRGPVFSPPSAARTI